MSFGFSVGDFLAALKLMSEAISSLGDAHGATSEYQALRRTFDCVSLAVQQTDRLSGPGAEAAKAAAFACQYPIVQFLERTKKYRKSLDTGCSSRFWLKDAARKIDWALTKKEDVRKLKADLNLHLECANMLFVGYGMDKLMSKESENASQICRKVEQTTNAISAMGVDLEAQTVAVRKTHSRLAQLMIIVSNELAQPIKSISTKVSELFTTTEQVRTEVQDLRESVLRIDTRFTWAQAPVKFEDALGRVYPIPSEFSFGTLRVIIEQRFRNVPGSSYVKRGLYEVYNARKPREFLSDAEDMQLLPGMQLTMAVLIKDKKWRKEPNFYPIMACGSRNTLVLHGRRRRCFDCGVTFEVGGQEHRFSTQNLPDNLSDAVSGERGPPVDSARLRNLREIRSSDDLEKLRNIRFVRPLIKGGIRSLLKNFRRSQRFRLPDSHPGFWSY